MISASSNGEGETRIAEWLTRHYPGSLDVVYVDRSISLQDRVLLAIPARGMLRCGSREVEWHEIVLSNGDHKRIAFDVTWWFDAY